MTVPKDNAAYLREWAADIRKHSGKSVDADRCDAMADEIDRLRAENKRLKVERPHIDAITLRVAELEVMLEESNVVDIVQQNVRLADRIAELEAEKDEAYRQRNYLVAGLTCLFPSGTRPTNIPGWEPDWHGCVYIDLPAGQISYHYHDSHAHLFKKLPEYEKPWDGHDKETVHARLLAATEKT